MTISCNQSVSINQPIMARYSSHVAIAAKHFALKLFSRCMQKKMRVKAEKKKRENWQKLLQAHRKPGHFHSWLDHNRLNVVKSKRLSGRVSINSPQKSSRLAPLHNGQNDYEMDVWRNGPFAPPIACSLTPLTPTHSLSSLAPLRSFVRSLAQSLTPELMVKRFV